MSKALSRQAQIRQLCTRIAREFKPEELFCLVRTPVDGQRQNLIWT
jgi:hypothetical protein